MDNLQQLVKPKRFTSPYDERIDVCNFHINKDAPLAERAEEYISYVKNPYAFRCGDIAVNIEFTKSGKTLEDVLASYLVSIRKNE